MKYWAILFGVFFIGVGSALDQIVFQDSRSLKRLPNIHLFPLDVLYNIDDKTHINIVKELQHAFRTRFFMMEPTVPSLPPSL